jgi:hypothetical protein
VKWQLLEINMRATLMPTLLLAAEKEFEIRQHIAESEEGMRWKVCHLSPFLLSGDPLTTL